MTKRYTQHASHRQYASLLACVLSCVLALCIAAAPAFADVRNSDRIAGSSIEERGLTTALCPNIEANHALLIDDTGKVYFERGAHDPVKIASITKVMTALVALDYDPSLKMTVTVTPEAAAIGESSAMLIEGDKLDMKNAVTAMMVASGNDAADAIAASVGGAMLKEEGHPGASAEKSVERFVQAMNDKASEMGLEDSIFANPHGLDDGEYAGDFHCTAYDVAAMVQLAMQNDTFRKVVGSETATVKITRDGETVTEELTSTDELLSMYEGTVGVKTGYTDEAGGCFAGANDHDGREYYAIILDSTDEWQRFLDTQDLWNWCYQYLSQYRLANAPESIEATIGENTGSYPLMARVAHLDWMDRSVAATIADPDQAIDVFALEGNISQEAVFNELHGSVHMGDVVGTLTFKQRNNDVATVDLIAAEDLGSPDIFTGIAIWWQRLWGNDTVAENEVLNTTPLLIDKTQTVSPGN
ncbi:MAG: serine hydrolase [Coriobacteriia bacterium]|nr:serine hydrolase [Coriobacteriia bacterium]